LTNLETNLLTGGFNLQQQFKKRKDTVHFASGKFRLDRPTTFKDVKEIKIEQVNGEFVVIYIYKSMALATTPNVFNKPLSNRNEVFGVKMFK